MEAINFGRELFCDGNGDVFPITTWLDEEGDPCDKLDAAFAIAGTEGRWHVLVLDEFDTQREVA